MVGSYHDELPMRKQITADLYRHRCEHGKWLQQRKLCARPCVRDRRKLQEIDGVKLTMRNLGARYTPVNKGNDAYPLRLFLDKGPAIHRIAPHRRK